MKSVKTFVIALVLGLAVVARPMVHGLRRGLAVQTGLTAVSPARAAAQAARAARLGQAELIAHREGRGRISFAPAPRSTRTINLRRTHDETTCHRGLAPSSIDRKRGHRSYSRKRVEMKIDGYLCGN